MVRSSAASAYLKITSGIAFIVVPKSRKFDAFVPFAVMISGAVSPSARLAASTSPVRTPGSAVRRVTRSVVRQTGIPSASDASRIDGGTSRITSCVVRITIGSVSTLSASEPAQPEKPRIGTSRRNAKSPATMLGMPRRMSITISPIDETRGDANSLK